MRYFLFIAILVVVSTHAAFGQAKSNKAQDEIKRLDKQWLIEPYFTSDMTNYDRIVADDFTITHSNGTVLSKAEKRANIIESHITDPNAPFRLIDSKVRIYDRTAVSIGSLNEAKSIVTFTNTYVKRNGHWQVVASHLNRRPKDQ